VKTFLRRACISVLILVLAMPVTFILTILLSPLWSWIEATYGIESMGHSGPADWCFWLIFTILGGAGLMAYLWFPLKTYRASRASRLNASPRSR